MSRIDLFICHVTEDRSVAHDLVIELERRGLRCWFAPRDIGGGQAYDDAIADALDDCRAMLLVFSDRCNESEYIRREVTVAGENGKVVIPLRIEDAKPRKGLKVRLVDLHWIDAFVERDKALDQLVTTIGGLPTGDTSAESRPTSANDRPTEGVHSTSAGRRVSGPAPAGTADALTTRRRALPLPLAAGLSAALLAGAGYWGFQTLGKEATSSTPAALLATAGTATSNLPAKPAETAKPSRITTDDPVFFDPGTGQAMIWFKTTPSGDIELFDAKGFHPRSGEALEPVTREVVDLWRAKHNSNSATPAVPPKPVDPKSYAFFDPISGKPRVWYWKVRDGQYEFFDAPGFHPKMGEPLALADKAFVADYKREQEEQENRLRAEMKAREDRLRAEAEAKALRERQEADRRADELRRHAEEQRRLAEEQKRQAEAAEKLRREQAEAAEKQRRDLAEAAEKQRREQAEAAERQRREQAEREAEQRRRDLEIREAERRAGDRCDELAGNPTDRRRKGAGVPYEILKLRPQDAIDACTKAVDVNPNEVRYQYQLARAVQMIDKARAFDLQKRVAAQQYPAAFDNLGWLYVSVAKNKAEAVRQFRTGAQLGDPDCMVSLAEMIDQKSYFVADPLREKIDLYKRAAETGHPAAQRALEVEMANFQQQQQQLMTQQQIQQQMIGLFGAALIGAMNKK